jgi:hypothetical protein|nr:MAG: hypothetical protein KatS3mg041_0555 [Bacteroidota bacterium]
MDVVRLSGGIPPAERGLSRALAQRASSAPSLSQEERSLIAQYFPESSESGLTVYKRRQVQELQPQALGRHIDIRG